MKLNDKELAVYREALKARVCSLCAATGYGEACHIGSSGMCPMDAHLARIVEAVLTTPRSDSLDDYVPKIRQLVCAACENQDAAGVCTVRNLAACGLDCFLLPVVQTVEETYDRLHPVTKSRAARRKATKRLCGSGC